MGCGASKQYAIPNRRMIAVHQTPIPSIHSQNSCTSSFEYNQFLQTQRAILVTFDKDLSGVNIGDLPTNHPYVIKTIVSLGI